MQEVILLVYLADVPFPVLFGLDILAQCSLEHYTNLRDTKSSPEAPDDRTRRHTRHHWAPARRTTSAGGWAPPAFAKPASAGEGRSLVSAAALDRQPAMANGRCRLHGGLSTGPRTAEGRARCARARLKHGAYSAADRALMAEGRLHFRRVHALLGRHATAGHGVLRSNSPMTSSGTSGAKIHHRGHRGHRARNPKSARAARNHSSSVHSVSSVVNPSTAGHGLLRPFPPSRPSPRAARLLAGTAPLTPFSAGHGLLRPFPVAGQFRPNDGPARPAGCRPDGSW